MTNRGLKMTNALMPFIAGLAVGIGGMWLTGNARLFGVVGLIAATIGVGLVGYGYFNWRAQFQRRTLSETDDKPRAE